MFTAKQIAEFIQADIVGNEEVTVTAFSKIEEAQEGNISFLANPKYEEYIYSTQASIVIVNKDFQPKKTVHSTLLKVEDAYVAFATLLKVYQDFKQSQLTGIETPSYVDSTVQIDNSIYVGAFAYIGAEAKLGKNVKIYPHAFIGKNVQLGDNVVIHPHVTIYEDCIIGNNCVIHAGSVIGADGFGFAPQKDGTFQKVPQIGNVIIEDNVEIGANTTIDRATMGNTLIKKGCKIDNLVQLAHNVTVGENTVIAAQSGISGSSKIGKNVMIGGQVGIVGHIEIADEVKIGAQSGVSKSIKESRKAISGTPATDIKQNLKSSAIYRQLPELEKRVFNIEKQLQEQNN